MLVSLLNVFDNLSYVSDPVNKSTALVRFMFSFSVAKLNDLAGSKILYKRQKTVKYQPFEACSAYFHVFSVSLLCLMLSKCCMYKPYLSNKFSSASSL